MISLPDTPVPTLPVPTLPHTLERVKLMKGWKPMRTPVDHRRQADGSLRIHRITIVVPQTAYLLHKYGDFALVDATFKWTIYEHR